MRDGYQMNWVAVLDELGLNPSNWIEYPDDYADYRSLPSAQVGPVKPENVEMGRSEFITKRTGNISAHF